MASMEIVFDLGALDKVNAALGAIGGEALARIATDSLNQAAERAYDLGKTKLRGELNLSTAYFDKRFELRKAQYSATPKASLFAGSYYTTLAHYNAQTVVENRPVFRGTKLVPKQTAVLVEVTRGAMKEVRAGHKDVFVIDKIRDSEGNPMIFQRLPGKTKGNKSKLKALYGPSVYQLFKTHLPTIAVELNDDLEKTILDMADKAISGEL